METDGGSSAQYADIAGRDVPEDRMGNNHVSQVPTRGPSVTFLTHADDHECCLPSIVLLFEIVFHVRAVEMRVKINCRCKEGYERPGSRAIIE